MLTQTSELEEVEDSINAFSLALAFPALIYILFCFVQGYMSLLAVALSAVFVLVVFYPVNAIMLKRVRLVVLSVYCLLLLSQSLPGYLPLIFWEDREISKGLFDSLYLNFDSILVMLALLPHFFLMDSRWKTTRLPGSKIDMVSYLTGDYRSNVISSTWVVTVIAVFGVLFYFQLATFDLKIPANWPYWLLVNVCVKVLAEEFFFRGVLQKELTKKYHLLAVFLVAGVYAMFHYRLGDEIVLLYFFLGLGCGYAYYKTQTIISSVYIHASVLMLHFFLLTYPSF